jgi:A/G-specific adenine glycosylase
VVDPPTTSLKNDHPGDADHHRQESAARARSRRRVVDPPTTSLKNDHPAAGRSPCDTARRVSTATAAARTVEDPVVAAVLAWWDAHARALPWRVSRDVYAIWVSEVMSAQTSVTRAAQAWGRWMARWPTVDALAAASLAEVLAEWQGLGYPRRARDLHRSARVVAADGWPDDLTELPGVGAYVAAAIECFAREEPVLPLDVNTRRVLARRFPEGIDTRGDPWRCGQALMEFGQRICSAQPRCELCPVNDGCTARGTTDPAPRARRQPRYEGSLRQRRGVLLRQVVAGGSVALAGVDREAADGLLQDGLLTVRDGCLRVPI